MYIVYIYMITITLPQTNTAIENVGHTVLQMVDVPGSQCELSGGAYRLFKLTFSGHGLP